jgi:hypothetical protein
VPPEAAVRKLVEAIILVHRIHPRLHKVLTEEVPRVGKLKRIEEVEGKLIALLRDALAARRHEVRRHNLDLVAFVVVHAVDGIIHGAVNFDPRRFEEDGLVEEVADLITRYLIA